MMVGMLEGETDGRRRRSSDDDGDEKERTDGTRV
jgi:hypothetical protein